MLRILSDLHFRDASSRLKRLEDLEPLLDGVEELWLDGDTCDNQSGMKPSEVAIVKAFFESRVPRVRFLTGNHDPDISEEHEASAADGHLWACHGDVFLDDIVPWSRVRDQLIARRDAVRTAHPEYDFNTFSGRTQVHRAACTGFSRECDPERNDFRYRLGRAWVEFFPPRQPWAMLQTWRTFPRRVTKLAAHWRPQARVIVTGHVHYPRVWREGNHWVVNLGAFSGPLGALTVEYYDERVVVRRIECRDSRWVPGAVRAEIPLA